MKIALIQMDINWNAVDQNLQRAEKLAEKAINQGAEFLIFPEMFVCGFSFLQGPAAQYASQRAHAWLTQCAERYGVWVCGSFPDSCDGQWEKPFNTLKVFGSGGMLGEYSKLHLFSFGGEGDKYRAGDKTLTVRIGECKVSFFICYDLRFPGPFAALAQDTDLYVVVANWPEARREHWCTLLSARAIENQAYVAAVNRVGEGGGLRYTGDSRLISPTGTVIFDAGNVETCGIATVELAAVQEYRGKFSVLRDRRDSLTIA